MSGANPVETKAGPAAALNPPAPSPALPAGRLGRYMKLGVVAAGSALVLAGGWYGFTHFSPTPDRVVAQSEPTPAAETSPPPSKPDEPIKRADPAPDNPALMDLPPVPSVPDIGPKPVKPPDSGFAALPPTPDAPAKPPGKPSSDVPLIDVPSVPDGDKKVKPEADAPPPLLPPDPPGSDSDKAKAADLLKKPAADPFKAPDALPDSDKPKADGRKTGPAPLPGDMTDKIKLDAPPPVIVSGATADPMPPAPPAPTPGKKDDPMGPPPVPKLDIDLPPPPATPDKKKDDVPPLVLPPTPDAPKPGPVNPAAGPDKKKDDVPTLVIPTKPAPAATDPKKDEVPRIEKIDLPNPDPVKPPTVTAEPPATTAPMPMTVAPPADPKKKDMYDEDWHTPRPGETFVMISQEYFHDGRYAQALEAYNKDRRKAGDGFIRVPPPWVLKEQFPNLAPKDDDRPAGPEAKPTSNIKFEAAAPMAPGARPAPPPVAAPARTTPTDEYRVIAKDGELIREVARKTLGDANAWRKLWDLNPDVDPTQPIPAGTTLRIPR